MADEKDTDAVTRAAGVFQAEMEELTVPPPGAMPADHRILPVQMPTSVMEDTGRPQFSLGDTAEFILVFIEDGDGDHGGADVVTLDAWAEEVRSPSWHVEQCGSSWQWWTILRGDGWAAQWAAPRPVVGRVRVTGSLHHDPYRIGLPDIPPTRGRICRIRLAGDDVEVDADSVRLPFPSIRAGQRSFSVRSARCTMDLDEAAAPVPWEGRPSWSDGFAAIPGRGQGAVDDTSLTLWRTDTLLPQIWKTDLHGGESETVTLPVKISEFRQSPRVILGPQGNGCVVALKGHRRLLLEGGDGSGISVSEVPVPPVLTDDMDQVVAAPESWGGWVVGRYEEADLKVPAAVDGTWHGPPQRGALHLGRVSDEGSLNWLNKDESNWSTTCARILATDDAVMTWKNNVLQYLDSELQVIGESRLPEVVSSEYMEVDTAGPWVTVRSFIIGGAGGGPETPGLRLSLVDPVTLEVVFSEPCGSRAQVQAEGRHTVWLADDRLRRFTRGDTGEWHELTYDSL
ncbi:MAG: hypothetical protein ACI38U_09095 [Corynebacterium sp.]|uniref:hypothetical protein n=1 Tax=unclassified Corynebacterium TaxID=2624378 RepID=UPI0011152300|nr:hypothetical protein [Corynebacterium sp. CNJ-954]